MKRRFIRGALYGNPKHHTNHHGLSGVVNAVASDCFLPRHAVPVSGGSVPRLCPSLP
ncbi:protein of unknown function [Rhodovastum atsumiense]|nr:protein of unknown function [Rhodovastum atsumiense]